MCPVWAHSAPLVGPQDGGNHRGVGLSAPHQKLHRRLRGLAGLADQVSGTATVGVHAIARRLLQIGLGQDLQILGWAPSP